VGKLVVTSFLSLDGVMQAPGAQDEDRSGGFAEGGWLLGLGSAEFGGWMADIFTRPSAFLLGRGTFDIFEGYWPRFSEHHPIGVPFNRLPKFVVSRTRTRSSWAGTTFVTDVKSTVESLKARFDGEIQVHGSPRLAETLLADRLVDEWNHVEAPVILGGGKRLFEGRGTAQAWKLTRHVVSPTGVVLRTLVPNGAIVHGAPPA